MFKSSENSNTNLTKAQHYLKAIDIIKIKRDRC